MVSLGGNRSYAYAINNSEQVVGYMENSEDDGTIAFLWDPVHGLRALGLEQHMESTIMDKSSVWETAAQ